MKHGIQLNPLLWRISRMIFVVAAAIMIVTIVGLFMLDLGYYPSRVRTYVVLALLLALPCLIAVRLRTVGRSMLWVVGPFALMCGGAVAAIGIIVSMTGAQSGSNATAEIFVYLGFAGLIALTTIGYVAYRGSDKRTASNNDT